MAIRAEIEAIAGVTDMLFSLLLRCRRERRVQSSSYFSQKSKQNSCTAFSILIVSTIASTARGSLSYLSVASLVMLLLSVAGQRSEVWTQTDRMNFGNCMPRRSGMGT